MHHTVLPAYYTILAFTSWHMWHLSATDFTYNQQSQIRKDTVEPSCLCEILIAMLVMLT